MNECSNHWKRRRFGYQMLAAALGLMMVGSAQATQREFWLTIEQVKLHVAPTLNYVVYAFNGQVPGPLIHIKEGDDVTVHVKNDTSVLHGVTWQGLYYLSHSWRNQGEVGITEPGIKPGHIETYKWKAEKAGALYYHGSSRADDNVAIRGMWGPLVIEPRDKNKSDLEKKVNRTAILMMSGWQSDVAMTPKAGGGPGKDDNYFSINGKSFPLDQPIRVNHGDVLRVLLYNPSMQNVSMHLHGHDMLIVRRDGRLLKAPFYVDTIQLTAGERYEAIVRCRHTEGRFIFHDHIDKHATNDGKYPGGIITVIEYAQGKPHDDKWYPWHDIHYNPNFFSQQDMKKPFGMYENPAYKAEDALPKDKEKFKGVGRVVGKL